MGYIIGERFDDFVLGQIVSRQQVQGSSYDGGKRNPNQMQLLNNRNAWLKCASSVYVDPQSEDEKNLKLDGYSNKYPKLKLRENFNPISIGEERLKANGLTPVENFTGTQLARKAVLFNTLSELSDKSYNQRRGVTNANYSSEKINPLWNQDNSYGLGGNKFGLNPAPGLISFSVESQNRGSVRRGTLTLKAYNSFQFQLIELLYLRIGYSMLVEWGWDKYSVDGGNTLKNTGNTIIEDQWFNDSSCTSQLEMIRLIDKYRNTYAGNYDGFFGRVENFQWEFNADGTYDIQIFLITVGAVVESLQVALPSPVITNKELEKLTKSLQEKEGTAIADSSIVSTAGDSQLSQDLFIDIASSDLFDGTNNNYINIQNIFGQRLYGKDEQKNTQTISRYNYFITLGEFLAKLEKTSIPLQINECSAANDLIINIDKLEDSNVCAVYPNQVAIDPRVCIVKPVLVSEGAVSDNVEFKQSEGWDKLKEFGKKEDVELASGEDSTILYGKIMNIYLNYEFIAQCLDKTDKEGKLSLYKFLTMICDGINRSLGYINNLEVSIIDDKTLKIIDQNPIVGVEESTDDIFKHNKPVPNPLFEIFGYNPNPGVKDPNNPDKLITTPYSNFVTDFKFTTRISPGTATTIVVGATAAGTSTKNYDGTAFSKWNEGLIDRYQYDIQDPTVSRELKEAREVDAAFLAIKGLQTNNNITEAIAVEIYNHYNDSKIDFTPGESFKSFWAATKAFLSTYNSYTPISGYYATKSAYKQSRSATIAAKGKTKALGVEFSGPRFVEDINGYGDFSGGISSNSITWADYVKAVDNAITVKNNEAAKLTFDEVIQKFSDNWDLWVVSALGGTWHEIVVSGDSTVRPNYWDFNETHIKNGFSAFKAYINALHNFIYKTYKEPSGTIGFIPADLSATFDGLSGIKIYNGLQIRQEILPPQYPETLKFLISTVNHEISENNWSTSINTLSVPNVSLVPGTFAFAELREAVRDYNASIGATVEYSGPTPNANILRAYIQQNNWVTEKQEGSDALGGITSPTISGGELTSGGDITKEMAEQGIIILAALHRELPNFNFRITGGNDLFHFNTPAAKNSRHRRGNALDITITPKESEDIAKVADVLGGFIVNPKSNVWYLNEYKDPVKYASGAHFHISIDEKEPKGTPEKDLAFQRYAEVGESFIQPQPIDLNALKNLKPIKDNFGYNIVNEKYEENNYIWRSEFLSAKSNRRINFKGERAILIATINATGKNIEVYSKGGNANDPKVPGQQGYYESKKEALANAKTELEAAIQKQLKGN